ncbi:hypothetical protein M1437_00435 [Patescibacteria group bacterium]|nr:hypothetical protein [Patescibacteria group bacterium]
MLQIITKSLKQQTTNSTSNNIPYIKPSAKPITAIAGWNVYTVDMNDHQFTIESPSSWKVQGLFDLSYQKIYKDALVENTVSFPVMNISNPELGFNQTYKDIPFNSLIITANKGDYAASKLIEYTNNQFKKSAKVDYFPGFVAYEIKSTEQENPADWQDDKNTPPPLKMLVQRRIAVQVSSNLVYEISYSIENASKYQNTISTYDRIISTFRFFLK